MKRMSMIGAVALGVTLVWACSSAVEEFILTPDASAGDSVSTSGERLQIRPIVYEGDDGSVIRMGEEIFDTELGVVCEPMLAADGVVRCLPKGAQELTGAIALMFSYSDPECSVHFSGEVPFEADCDFFRRIDREASACGRSEESHRIFTAKPHTGIVYEFGLNGEGCIPVTSDPVDGWLLTDVTHGFEALRREE